MLEKFKINFDGILKLFTGNNIIQSELYNGEHDGMYFCTRRGLKHERKKVNNEDALLVNSKDNKVHVRIMAVADGVGGIENGDIASKTLLYKINKWFIKQDFSEKSKEKLQEIIHDNIKQIFYEMYEDFSRKYGDNMPATTFSCAIIIDNNVYIVNVGDSRIYIEDGKSHDILQLTSDDYGKIGKFDDFFDTSMADNIQIRRIAKERARYHDENIDNLIDAAVPCAIKDFEVTTYELQEGDTLKLVTDGITDTNISQELAGKTAEQLVEAGRNGIYRGGITPKDDDCTAITYLYRARGEKDGK